MEYFKGLVESFFAVYLIGEGAVEAKSAEGNNSPWGESSALRFWTCFILGFTSDVFYKPQVLLGLSTCRMGMARTISSKM